MFWNAQKNIDHFLHVSYRMANPETLQDSYSLNVGSSHLFTFRYYVLKLQHFEIRGIFWLDSNYLHPPFYTPKSASKLQTACVLSCKFIVYKLSLTYHGILAHEINHEINQRSHTKLYRSSFIFQQNWKVGNQCMNFLPTSLIAPSFNKVYLNAIGRDSPKI